MITKEQLLARLTTANHMLEMHRKSYCLDIVHDGVNSLAVRALDREHGNFIAWISWEGLNDETAYYWLGGFMTGLAHG